MQPENNGPHWSIKCYLMIKEAWSYALSAMFMYFILYDGYREFQAGDHYPWSVLVFGVYVYLLRLQYTDIKMPWQ